MGRELKRVPMNFDWPLNQKWKGYLNPHYKECGKCKGSGQTTARQRLGDLVHLLMISASDALRGKAHPWLCECSGLLHTQGMAPSMDMVELTTGFSERSLDFMGHDAIDRFMAEKKIIEAAGLSESWGTCAECDGEGIDPQMRAAYEAWEKYDPPSGKGYQLWETTSEGSPISPIFETLDALCDWLEQSKASVFGSHTATAIEWKRMLDENFVRHQEGNMVFI